MNEANSTQSAQIDGNEMTLTLAPGVDMKWVRIPAGWFWMGSGPEDKHAQDHEKPQHQVYLEEFWIGVSPVTVAQFQSFVQASGYRTTAENIGYGNVWTGKTWEKIQGANWCYPTGPGPQKADEQGKLLHPVTHMSWYDALAFCRWVNEQILDRAGMNLQVNLPTETEWEKAARGRSDGRI